MTLSFGCSKETELEACEDSKACVSQIVSSLDSDTIFPSDYIMAYPGSWWSYSDNSVDSCLRWQEIPIYKALDQNTCPDLLQQNFTVPLLKNSNNYNSLTDPETTIFYDSIPINGLELAPTSFAQIIDSELGVTFSNEGTGGSGQYAFSYTRTYETVDTIDSIELDSIIYNDILVIEYVYTQVYSHTGGGPVTVLTYYYARDIGLVSFVFKWGGSYSSAALQSSKNLTDYHIAPH
ncbi:MAG: hypothetical protein AB8B53_12100 [Flavobacteriales bacterium]